MDRGARGVYTGRKLGSPVRRPALCLLLALGCRGDPPGWEATSGVRVRPTGGPTGGAVTALLAEGDALWVGTASGQVFRSRDAGATFDRTAPLPALVGFVDPDPVTALARTRDRLWMASGRRVWWSDDDGASWVEQEEDRWTPTDQVVGQGDVAWLLHDPAVPWRHPDTGTPDQPIDELFRDLDAVGSVVVGVTGDCGLRRSTDGGATFVTVAPPEGTCPARTWLEGGDWWVHDPGVDDDPSGTWVRRGEGWEAAGPPDIRDLAWAVGTTWFATDAGRVVDADGELLEGPEGVRVLAGTEDALWIGASDGLWRYDGGAAAAPVREGLTGIATVAGRQDGETLWVAGPGAVHALEEGRWREVGRPGDEITTLAAREGRVVAGTTAGPAWIAGPSPVGEGWPMQEREAVPAPVGGLAFLPGGALVATTTPDLEVARTLSAEPGAPFFEVSIQVPVGARSPLALWPLADGVLATSLWGWAIAQAPTDWQEVGPGAFDRPPYPIVRDVAVGGGETWVALVDVLDEVLPCERCGPARQEGPTFPVRTLGLPAEVLVEGIAVVDEAVLLTTRYPDPALYRLEALGWTRLARLPGVPRGPLHVHGAILRTDTLGAGIVELRPAE